MKRKNFLIALFVILLQVAIHSSSAATEPEVADTILNCLPVRYDERLVKLESWGPGSDHLIAIPYGFRVVDGFEWYEIVDYNPIDWDPPLEDTDIQVLWFNLLTNFVYVVVEADPQVSGEKSFFSQLPGEQHRCVFSFGEELTNKVYLPNIFSE